MPQPRYPRESGPPRNHGVRELVASKRRWSSPPKRKEALLGFRGWHERGYLPHRDEPGLKVGNAPLGVIVGDLKEYTAREANKLLGRHGKLWADDSFDTFMRDATHELRTRRYIENNPVKAFLVREGKEWPWSSARFRDANGVLHL